MPKDRGILNYSRAKTADQFVLWEVAQERLRQEKLWGEQNHTQMIWLGILAEEFGEAAQQINELHFRAQHLTDCLPKERRQLVRDELIQVAAVAVAMIESLDRNGE